MINHICNQPCCFVKQRNKQTGAALIIFFFVLILAGSAVLFSVLDSNSIKIERDKKTALMLSKAKTALIGYAIGDIGGSQRPGDLIRPDSPSETPADYDGTADASCLDATKINGLPLVSGSSGINMRCLGRLPWKDLGISISAPSEGDPNGIMPWYAVSANLVDPTCLTVLNSNTLNLVNNPPPAPLDCSGATLPYPWLTVRDSNGNIVSNRVAAIIFVPGAARGAQSRPSSPGVGAADQYLDTLVVPVGCTVPCVPGTYNNAGMNNDFIIASEGMPSASASNFNDQLVYITIEELMTAVEKRVAQEAASQLRNYYLASSGTVTNRFYPYAASLGDTNNACMNNKLTGLLPITPASASCTTSTSCSVSFPMTKVSFNLVAGSYTSKTGACSRLSNTCTCTGSGSCTKSGASSSTFLCDSNGNCSSTGISPNGTFDFVYTPKTPDVTMTTGLCAGSSGTVSCTGLGSFSSPPTTCTHPNPGLSALPSWFTDNHWQDFMYYVISNDCGYATPGPGCVSPPPRGLAVGTKTSVNALIISAGRELSATEALPTPAQARPSSNILDYLDSMVNTDADSTYDPVGKLRGSIYNDQMFIVAP